MSHVIALSYSVTVQCRITHRLQNILSFSIGIFIFHMDYSQIACMFIEECVVVLSICLKQFSYVAIYFRFIMYQISKKTINVL